MAQFYPLKLYFRNKPIFIMSLLSVSVNLALIIWLLTQIGPQEQEIFLHYNILFGVDYLGAWWKAVYLPLTGLFIILINAFIGWILFREDKIIAYILAGVTLVCQFFLMILGALLVFLNV